jgi:hypothetical protein
MGNDGTDPPLPRGRAIGVGIIAFVGESSATRNLRTEVEQGLEVRAVADLASGQVEGDRLAVEVALEVGLGREAATGAAERLTVLPPFAPAAETCARTIVESNI